MVTLTVPLTVDDTYLDAVAERSVAPTSRASVRCCVRDGRGHRREPDARISGPGHPRQRPIGWVPGNYLRCQPKCRPGGGRAVLPHRCGATGTTGSGRSGSAGGRRLPGRRGLWPARDTGAGGSHLGSRPRPGADLLTICRRYGMRLVGPNCFGIADTTAGLDLTFGVRPPVAGSAGVVVQSGGVGIALLAHLARLEIGVSSFVSVGDKYDVSSNDLLRWWPTDEATRLGVLYLESFGNPRKFARIARQLSRSMPLLTVLAGRSDAGARAAASHTAAAATPAVTREALFGQAGVIATPTLGELRRQHGADRSPTASVRPTRRCRIQRRRSRVLAADACIDAGLVVPVVGKHTQETLSALLPTGAGARPGRHHRGRAGRRVRSVRTGGRSR